MCFCLMLDFGRKDKNPFQGLNLKKKVFINRILNYISLSRINNEPVMFLFIHKAIVYLDLFCWLLVI